MKTPAAGGHACYRVVGVGGGSMKRFTGLGCLLIAFAGCQSVDQGFEPPDRKAAMNGHRVPGIQTSWQTYAGLPVGGDSPAANDSSTMTTRYPAAVASTPIASSRPSGPRLDIAVRSASPGEDETRAKPDAASALPGK